MHILASIETDLLGIDWSQYPQPEWNRPDEVPNALRSLFSLTDGAVSSRVYSKVMYALGNNHAGTYFPVILGVLPFLERAVEVEETQVSQTAFAILDDQFASFQPDPAFRSWVAPNGAEIDVEAEFVRSVVAMRATVERVAQGGGINGKLAAELLELIDAAPERAAAFEAMQDASKHMRMPSNPE